MQACRLSLSTSKSAQELHLHCQAWQRAAHPACPYLQEAPLKRAASSDSDMAGSSALQEVLRNLSTAPTVRQPHEGACIHKSAPVQSLLRLWSNLWYGPAEWQLLYFALFS